MTWRHLAGAAAVIALVLPLCASAEVVSSRYRKPAPGFTLMDAKRTPVTLSDYKGKVVLLDFWTTWSGGSKVEMPWFAAFDAKYRNSGLTVIGVSLDDEGWPIVSPYLEAHPVGYPIVLGSHEVAERYDIASLPVTVLIDRNGRIAAKHFGVVEQSTLENEIRKLLKERPKKNAGGKRAAGQPAPTPDAR